MPPPVRPMAAMHNEWAEVLRRLVDRLRSKRVAICLPYLPGKGRANIQPVFKPEKGEDGWGEQLKRELYELINGVRAKEEKTTLLEGPDGVLGVIAKLEKEGCPIGDEQAFARLAARFGVQVSAGERNMRRNEGGRLDPERSAQSPPRLGRSRFVRTAATVSCRRPPLTIGIPRRSRARGEIGQRPQTLRLLLPWMPTAASLVLINTCSGNWRGWTPGSRARSRRPWLSDRLSTIAAFAADGERRTNVTTRDSVTTSTRMDSGSA